MKLVQRQRGSISIEAALCIPVLMLLIVASSQVFSVLRVEQRLTNVAYNITQLVSNKIIMDSPAALLRLGYYQDYADQQLSSVAAGRASLTIERYNAATGLVELLLRGSGCQAQVPWPSLAVGSVVKVTLCYQADIPATKGWMKHIWPHSGFQAHFIQEVN
ncbi:TadE/TadG family type IV pilus assembly protein [Motilimonas cestriensis]|uniref:Pilus assembly protein n=1 Tax=Motilimonas cestriensis TaxID=2742685 RepID=A0ABS8WCI4_9GAMM|nr:TadE/TadG family type IV pilus assembly protein [Motilimonas cestriensis]MCE2596746.1 pilus assembly protein [Motilimonas cestriensis]